MSRVVITGGPRTGKTTMANNMVGPVKHTDDLIAETAHLGKDSWSEASRLASLWMDEPGPWVIEGVAASRALRKWREAHPGEAPPVDRVIYLETPHEELSKGQASMAKGVAKVHSEVEDWLAMHGVKTERM